MPLNSLEPRHKVADIYRDSLTESQGISREGDLLDLGVDVGVIDKSGSWYSFKGERIGQGRMNVIQFLRDNEDMCGTAMEEVKQKIGLVPEAEAEPEETEES